MTSNPQNSYQLIAKYFSGNHTKREITVRGRSTLSAHSHR